MASDDVTGDGIDDAIFGSNSCTVPTGGVAGNTYIIYGANAAPGKRTMDIQFARRFSRQPGLRVDTIIYNIFAYLGVTKVMTVDMNGDGKKDLLILGNYISTGIFENVKAIFNDAWGSSTTWTFNTTNITGNNGYDINISASNGTSTNQSWAVADLNADNYNDLIVGAGVLTPNSVSQAGSTYIVWGKASGYANNGFFNVTSTYKGTAWTELDGDYANEYAGQKVAVGDFDHDGKTDIAIAAPGNSPNSVSGAGSVYVVWGGTKWSTVVSGGRQTLETVVNR